MGKKLMHSNEQSPWEFQVVFKKFSAIHGIKSLLLCSLSSTMVPTLIQMNATHTIPVYAFKIYFIYPPTYA